MNSLYFTQQQSMKMTSCSEKTSCLVSQILLNLHVVSFLDILCTTLGSLVPHSKRMKKGVLQKLEKTGLTKIYPLILLFMHEWWQKHYIQCFRWSYILSHVYTIFESQTRRAGVHYFLADDMHSKFTLVFQMYPFKVTFYRQKVSLHKSCLSHSGLTSKFMGL